MMGTLNMTMLLSVHGYGGMVVKMCDPERFIQDDAGQWWYLYTTDKQKNKRQRTWPKVCDGCGADFLPTPGTNRGKPIRFCTNACSLKAAFRENPDRWKADRSHRWKGGKVVRNGYVYVFCPGHHSFTGTKNQYVPEHRLVMEKRLGRPLTSKENVHHINGVRSDNRDENLELWVVEQPPGARLSEKQHCETCTCYMEDRLDG